MMGPLKPAEIRARIREQSGLTEAELAALFAKQIADADDAVAKSLRLFRDALLKETKRTARRSVNRRTAGVKK